MSKKKNTEKSTVEKKAVKKEVKKEEIKEVVKDNKKEVKDSKKKVDSDKLKEKAIKGFEKIDENRKIIYGFAAGLLLGLLILALQPKKIAELKDGTQPVAYLGDVAITADDYYTDMKKQYSAINLLIDLIDNNILVEKYPETDEMKADVEKTATYWFNTYNSYYGYDEETFLSKNGFSNRQAFIEYLTLDYRRNLYYEGYLKKQFTDKDIEKYYESSVYGDINTKHMLVSVDESKGLSDADAKKLAEEIISKLNNGASWDDVKAEYKDKITTEDLGYQSFDASLDEAYVAEMKSLENGTYSKTPIKSSYGYHVVYRIDQKEKPKLDDVKDAIIEQLGKELEKKDTNIRYKALIAMREESKLKFTDEDLEAKYNKYVSNYK